MSFSCFGIAKKFIKNNYFEEIDFRNILFSRLNCILFCIFLLKVISE